MTTVHFLDGTLEYSDTKTARAKLRKMGLTVKNAQKRGDNYYFDCPKPDGAVYVPRARTEARAKVDLWMKGPDCKIQPQPNVYVGAPSDDIDTTMTMGSALKPFDVILDFVPGISLTIDYRGIVEIHHEAENITRQSQSYLGFYSLESNGIASFRIDPKRVYSVISLADR